MMKKTISLLLAVLLLCTMFVIPTTAANYGGTVTVSAETVNRNGEVTVSITLSECRTLKSMMLKNLSYDEKNLELVSGTWKIADMAISSNLLAKGKASSMALNENTDINGTVYELKFKAKASADFKEYPISITVIANYMDDDNADKPVTLNFVPGKITVECVHDYSSEWSMDADNHWHECSVCNAKKDMAEHTFEWVTDLAATEEATGLKHEECTVCGCKRNENTIIDKLAHTHHMLHTAAAAASCKETGNIEYWYCTKCEKYFKDEAGTQQITLAETVTQKTAHTLTHTEAKAATCTAEGNIEYWYCTVCETYFADSAATQVIAQDKTPIAMKEHTPAEVWSADDDEHWHACTGCSKKMDVTAHTYLWVIDTEPTDVQTGVKHEACSVCGHKRSEGTPIPKVGDVNADGAVNSDDAIYLLNYTLRPSAYPITGKCDFDGDGNVTSEDAIYLLNYTLNSSEYPLMKPFG